MGRGGEVGSNNIIFKGLIGLGRDRLQTKQWRLDHFQLLSGRVAHVHISVAATFGLEVWYYSDCRGYHPDCRVYHSDCRVAHMMALSWYNWETLYGYFHDLQIVNCPWGLFGWACWLKEDKIRAGITSGAWLNLDGRAEYKLDLAWCNAQGDNWFLEWSTYIDPTVMFWGLWGHGVNMMELALNFYFWMWIESLHYHRKGDRRYDYFSWNIVLYYYFRMCKLDVCLCHVSYARCKKYSYRSPHCHTIRYQFLPFLYSRDGTLYVVWGHFWGLDIMVKAKVKLSQGARV
ncbi:hypothetical protein L1987_76587 [Smallanthus sonchifolius]|uniref:Uncharacterized protein n=1 Tax=Smallanthus sonchifolius TaxID=185202 RepID=A0ACB8Z8P0_9ASTR|nr:hypothetical protein L1987_76587 [Smallanthus sonchifolius]